MNNQNRLEFGCFFAPFHPTNENPTLSLKRDLDLIEWLDYLNYDEVWLGEHHSGGWGIISSPELMIAAAAQRTKKIRLGTGVTSLPYHNPLMVANRITQLDHMTEGRLIFGVGSGQLPSDAYMLNINPSNQRRMMQESLEAILHLLEKEEPLTMKTDWFTLNEARVHLRPYTNPRMEIAVASLYSPNSATLVGKHGLSMLSLGGMLPGDGLVNLQKQWKLAEKIALESGKSIDRSNWRLIIPMHVAETREEAFRDVRHGGHRWIIEYFRDTHGRPVKLDAEPGYELDAMAQGGGVLIGSVEDCIEGIQNLIDITGGFGKIIAVAQDWAPTEKVKKSFELIARYVMPKFQGSLNSIETSKSWVAENNKRFSHEWSGAQDKVLEK